MNKAKAIKTCKEYFKPIFSVCLFDCSDSWHESEALENRFNAFVDDKIDIDEFIEKNLLKEYTAALQQFVNDNDIDEESCESPVMDFPVSYKKMKGKITFTS